jgi:hypothetical protein
MRRPDIRTTKNLVMTPPIDQSRQRLRRMLALAWPAGLTDRAQTTHTPGAR